MRRPAEERAEGVMHPLAAGAAGIMAALAVFQVVSHLARKVAPEEYADYPWNWEPAMPGILLVVAATALAMGAAGWLAVGLAGTERLAPAWVAGLGCLGLLAIDLLWDAENLRPLWWQAGLAVSLPLLSAAGGYMKMRRSFGR